MTGPVPPAMLFAAGFGTRMGALTRDRPKPLVPVAGRTLLDRALDRLAAAGVPLVVVNLHYRGGMIRDHLAGRREPRVLFSEEAPDILETGGGLRAALPLLGDGPVLTLNPDGIWSGEDPVGALLAAWDPGRMEALLHLVPRAAARGHEGAGDFVRGPDGRLARRGAAPTAPWVYSGVQVLHTGRVAAEPPGAFSLNRVWDAMIGAGGLFGVAGTGPWADVGRPEGLAAAEAMLAEAG